MLSMQGTNITITRGDSAYIIISLTDSKGNHYTPGPDDKIRAQVRQDASSSKVLFESLIPYDTLVWHIKPEDTAEAQMGKSYVYDMEIETAEGDVYTFIPLSSFTVSKEVTRIGTE